MKEMPFSPDAAIAQQELGAVLADLPILVARFDPVGECVAATLSPALDLPFGVAALVGQAFDDVIAFPDDPGAAGWRDKLASAGRTEPMSVRLRANGAERHMVASGQVWHNGDTKKQDAGTLVVLRDETASETEQRENFFLTEIARRTNNIVAVTDVNRRLVWVNDAFERRTGYTMQEALGKRPADLVQFEGTDKKTVAAVAAAIRRNEPVQAELLNRSKTGEKYWLDIDIQPLRGPEGILQGYMGVQTDITRLKRLQEKAESATRRAEVRAKELSVHRHQLREAIDAQPYGFAMYDDKDRLVIFNENFRKLVRGEAKKIVRGARYEAIMREVVETGNFLATQGERENWLRKKIEGIRNPVQEFQYFKADTGQWVKAIDKRTPDGGLVSMRLDITDLKAAEERLTMIIKGAGVGTWTWSAATQVSEIDAPWAEILGYKPDELGVITYERLADMMHPEDRGPTFEIWDSVYRGESDISEPIFRLKHKDGHWVNILSRGMVLRRDADGCAKTVSGVHIDITEHTKREAALRRALSDKESAEKRFCDISAVSDDWFWEQDETLRFTWHSESFSRVTGASSDFLLGKTRQEIRQSDPRTRDAADWDWLEARMAAREPFRNFQYPIYINDADRPSWLRASGSPVLDAEGVFRGYRGIGTDITALVEACERAEEANRTKSLFLANMSHEIRTPLNGVLGMAELLSSEVNDPASQRMVGIIRESGESLLAILNDLLDMSKIEAGHLELEMLPFCPADIAKQVERLHMLRAEEKGLNFDVFTCTGAMHHRMGDPNRVRQILNNLISNAIKFTEQGEVLVKLSARKGGALVIEVQDTGIGMTKEYSERLFGNFTQADTSITRRFGGTGLGMAIVGRLVDMMGGKIRIESEPDEGTRITVELPLAEGEPTAQPEEAATTKVRSLKGLRVLAADDNETNRLLLREMLTPRGVEVTLVSNGAEAVEIWEPGRFDVLILDISMPVMDGISALTRLREIAEETGVALDPSIAFTAHAMAHQVVEYIAAGFDTHLAKPFHADDLVHAISALVPIEE